jgi:hypothetical protein
MAWRRTKLARNVIELLLCSAVGLIYLWLIRGLIRALSN